MNNNNNFRFYKFDKGRVFMINTLTNQAFIVDNNGKFVEYPLISARILDVDCDYYEITESEFYKIIDEESKKGRRF